VQPDQKTSNRPFFTKLLPAQPSAPARIEFTNLKPGYYRLTVRRTGFKANDAYSRYLELGSPKDLTTAQLAELQGPASDVPESVRQISVGGDSRYSLQLPMRTNDVVLLQLEPAANAAAPERG
jgi:xylan 1,4-beta-xylosidase